MKTTAEMISEVIATLGDPPQDWISAREAARILRNRLSLVLTRLNQSDQNHTESFVEFDLNGQTQTALMQINNGTPDWAEYADGFDPGIYNTGYRYAPTVNLDSLEDFRRENRPACAFFRDQTGVLQFRTTGYASRWRVWYAPNWTVLKDLSSSSQLPPNFNFLITDGTVVDSVGFLLNNAARDTQNPPSELQVMAWKEIQSRAADRLVGWESVFTEYVNRSKGGQRGRMRRPVLRGRMNYGGRII